MLGLGASLRLLDAAIKGDAAAHAGYESAGAMAAACAALATSKRTAGKGLAEVVCCLARDGVPAAVLVDFVGDSLELARLVQRREGYYASVSTDASWNGATVAHALCAGRDRLLADHSTTVNALQLPPGASVCLAQFGHSHTQFEAAFTKAMRRAATTSEAGAFAAFRILRALADTTSSYTGASAARLVDVVGDVLVQALSVTFPLRQITVPAYYRNDAARAATYVTEETEKARKEAKDAAAVTLTAALSALVVPGATTARCLAAAAPVVCANAARFDGIVAVPAAVMAPLYRRNVLEPAAVSALEAIAAAAATAPAPSQKLSVEQCESLLITLAATGGAGRRAALFDEEDAWTVVRAASSVLSGGLSNAVYDRTGRGQYSSKTLAKVVNDDLSLPRILLAAMARVPTVTAERWSRSPVLETPRNALAAAVYALCAGESRGATGQLDALAALVARTPAFDPLRAVAPAIEMLADVTSRRPRLQAEGLASPALLALCSLALAPLRSATVAPPPLKDWKLTVDLGLGDAWKVKSIEEFFADPVADKRTHAIRDDDDERVARKLEELQSPDAFTATRTESRYGPRLEIAKVPAGQAPKEDIRARIASEELRAKDLATLRTLEGLLPQPSGPPTAGDSSSDDEPEKKKQSA